MVKVVVIEDEHLAAERLTEVIKNCDATFEVVAHCDSVKQTVKWFCENPKPSLVFMDIQLGDGLCFEIFEQVEVACPIIFTTAYNEYAIQAFKVNSLAYLLKPIKLSDLSAAIEKYKASPYFTGESNADLQFLYQKTMQMITHQYKKRFLIKVGVHIKSIPVDDILFFYSYEKGTFVCTSDGKNYLVDYTLEQLKDLLDPLLFFRINRKYYISVSAIADMLTHSTYRLKLKLYHCSDDDIYVSRDKMQEFKEWLDK